MNVPDLPGGPPPPGSLRRRAGAVEHVLEAAVIAAGERLRSRKVSRPGRAPAARRTARLHGQGCGHAAAEHRRFLDAVAGPSALEPEDASQRHLDQLGATYLDAARSRGAADAPPEPEGE